MKVYLCSLCNRIFQQRLRECPHCKQPLVETVVNEQSYDKVD
jgi:rRNA maturation endonuclease Nob1